MRKLRLGSKITLIKDIFEVNCEHFTVAQLRNEYKIGSNIDQNHEQKYFRYGRNIFETSSYLFQNNLTLHSEHES